MRRPWWYESVAYGHAVGCWLLRLLREVLAGGMWLLVTLIAVLLVLGLLVDDIRI